MLKTLKRQFATLCCLIGLTLPGHSLAETIVTVTTNLGSFQIRMFEAEAPGTVENFLGYVRRGDYDGTFIHRSVPGFVIQGGGYRYVAETNSASRVTAQAAIQNEFGVSNTRGTVAMAKLGGDPDSATNEWFVNLADNSGNLDNQNGGFTVFGEVIGDGMDIVDQIAAQPRQNFGSPFTTVPTVNFTGTVTPEIFVTLESVTVNDNQTSATAYLFTTSSSSNVTELHVINTADDSQQFRGTLYNGSGEQLGAANQILNSTAAASQGRVVLNATQLESIFSVSAWRGPAMLEVTGSSSFELMSKLTSPSGLISNTNCVTENQVHNIEGSDSASRTFVRFINTNSESIGPISGQLIDQNGQVIGSGSTQLIEALIAKQAVWLNRDDLETLFGIEWEGLATLKLQNAPAGLKLLNLNFVNDETFFNFSCFESSDSGYVYLMTNSDSANVSETHLINNGDAAIDFKGTVYAGSGEQLGSGSVSLQNGLIESGGRLILTAKSLEELVGADPWRGPALIRIEGTPPFVQMTRLKSPSGLISNTNCVRRGAVHNIEGFDSDNLTFVRLINQGDATISNVTGILYDLEGNSLGGSKQLAESLAPKEARWLNRNDLSEVFGVNWNGEASLVVSADSDDDLRLLNLNFVNSETFFNFSCYEGSE